MANTQLLESSPTQQEIIDFLIKHPNFLKEHPELIEKLNFPEDGSGNVTSFANFQAQKLKQRLERLEERNKLLIHTSIQNQETIQQINDLVIALLSMDSIQQVNECLQGDFKDDLELASVAILTIGEEAGQITMDNVQELMGEERVALRSAEEEDAHHQLHGDNYASIASEAMLKLNDSTVLLLGSDDQQRFHEGQGSELLQFFASILEICLKRIS